MDAMSLRSSKIHKGEGRKGEGKEGRRDKERKEDGPERVSFGDLSVLVGVADDSLVKTSLSGSRLSANRDLIDLTASHRFAVDSHLTRICADDRRTIFIRFSRSTYIRLSVSAGPLLLIPSVAPSIRRTKRHSSSHAYLQDRRIARFNSASARANRTSSSTLCLS